jgi:hypothetical protein
LSLYAITSEIQSLASAFEQYGHASEEAAAAIREHTEALVEAFDAKADSYAQLIRVAETRAAARNEESERLRKLAQDDEVLASRLRIAIMEAMTRIGRPKVQTERFSLSVRKNGGKTPVVIHSEDMLPEEYKVPRITVVIDKEAIRAALEGGSEIPGAELGERGSRLDLR